MKRIFFLLLFCAAPWTFAGNASLCQDLARVSCAPENQKKQTTYQAQAHAHLLAKFKNLLANPNEAVFKKRLVALKAKNEDEEAEILATLAEKESLGSSASALPKDISMAEKDQLRGDKAYDKIVSDLDEQIQKDLASAKGAQEIQKTLLLRMKNLISQRINEMDQLEPTQKKQLVDKVKAIQFDKTPCTSVGQGGEQKISPSLTTDIFYSPTHNTLQLCPSFLLHEKDEFQLALELAQELSHSIDPCSIAMGTSPSPFKYKKPNDLKAMKSQYPLHKLLSCLQEEKASEAKVHATFFCEAQNNTNTNSISDWMTAEVLPRSFDKKSKLEYQAGYAHAATTLCGSTDESRINRILLANPKIREQMGCPPQAAKESHDCSEKPSAAARTQTPAPEGGRR